MRHVFLKAMMFGLAGFAGMALAASGDVYIADEGGNTVTVVDGKSFKRVATIRVGRSPHNVEVAPDGRLAWVTNEGETAKAGEHTGPAGGEHKASSAPGEVWAIDTANRAVVAKVAVGLHPAHVTLTPDGRFAYVTNGGDNSVSVIDTEARKQVASIAVGTYPHGLRISPDGSQAFVANLKGGTVSVIDTSTRKEIAQIPVGKGPAQTGFAPDGRLAFVSLSQENRVALVDVVGRKVVGKVEVGTVPIQLYATPDGKTLFVANQGTRQKPGTSVSVIDLQTRKVVKTVQTGAGAHGVALDRGGQHVFVTNIYADTLSVLDASSAKVLATVKVGRSPNGVSVQP